MTRYLAVRLPQALYWSAAGPVATPALPPATIEVSSFHVYPFNPCDNPVCWDDQIAPLAEIVPIIVGEVAGRIGPHHSAMRCLWS